MPRFRGIHLLGNYACIESKIDPVQGIKSDHKLLNIPQGLFQVAFIADHHTRNQSGIENHWGSKFEYSAGVKVVQFSSREVSVGLLR